MTLLRWCRDWRRGYTATDAKNVAEKMTVANLHIKPGMLIPLTHGELMALNKGGALKLGDSWVYVTD